MHLLFLASVFLSLSAYAAADWVTFNEYKEYDSSCATSTGTASAYVLNTCIPFYTYSSSYYNYSASINSSLVIKQSYRSTDCTGTHNDDTYIFGQCSFNEIGIYSATKPQASGFIRETYSNTDNTCASSAAISQDITNFGICSYGVKYGYNGGGACFTQQYNNSDCTGPINYGYARSGVSCYRDSSSYCSVNGVTLPQQRVAPTVVAGSNYITYRSYSKSNCTGTSTGTSYSFASGCDGEGTLSNYGASSYTSTVFDNANCTGYQVATTTTNYNSQNSDSIIGKCQANNYNGNEQSYKSTLEPLPSGSFVTIGAITVDNCQNPTQTYFASIYTNGCVQDNRTSSSKISCVVAGANTTFTSTIYNSIDCSGPVAATEVFSEYTCAPSENNPYVSLKFLCNAALPRTSDATTTSSSYVVYVAVMMIAAVAYVL